MPKVIATDLDGTLFYPKKRIRMISPKTLKFLRRFIDDGNRLILVSGRNVQYTKKVQKRIARPVDVIGCNASFVICDNQMIKESVFPLSIKEVYQKLLFEFHPVNTIIMTKNGNYYPSSESSFWYKTGYRFYSFFQGVYREKILGNTEKFHQAFEEGTIYKIMLMFGVTGRAKRAAKEANKIIREKYSDVLEASWSDQVIELSPVNCSKAEGLKYYADYLKINHNDIYVVGDSGNDISMFKEFHNHSFCMSRGSLSVSKHAKHVIKHVWEIENYIEKGNN